MRSGSSFTSRQGEALRLSLVAADPRFTTEDYLGEESAVIRSSFEEHRARVAITTVVASTDNELLQHVSEVRPEILHFTGHGGPLAQVSLRTSQGPFRRKTAKTLARLFRSVDLVPQCIVLNNCSLFRSEDWILSVCDNFVRMKPRGVFDYALGFAKTFYTSLVTTERYDAAFEHTIATMREAGVLDSVKIVFKRGEPRDYVERQRGRVEMV